MRANATNGNSCCQRQQADVLKGWVEPSSSATTPLLERSSGQAGRSFERRRDEQGHGGFPHGVRIGRQEPGREPGLRVRRGHGTDAATGTGMALGVRAFRLEWRLPGMIAVPVGHRHCVVRHRHGIVARQLVGDGHAMRRRCPITMRHRPRTALQGQHRDDQHQQVTEQYGHMRKSYRSSLDAINLIVHAAMQVEQSSCAPQQLPAAGRACRVIIYSPTVY
jgi:hypothetical protein